jgi:prevent-host-death family protein
MTTVNMHEAKTHLSKLVARAAKGEQVIIARAGKPVVRLVAVEAPARPKRTGFLKGEIAVPDDFNEMGAAEIATLFGAAR